MSISYSGLTNYGKVTLPSVESWGTNMNIIKDPPRSVMTRKNDKVFDTSQITATIAASDDRLCEYINYYARSNNPMVSVSYGEGQSEMTTTDHGQAYLPYRVVRDGAFRPPVWRQEDLLPLSRLPRNWTTVDARPFEADYTKRVFNCGTAETTKEVRNNIMTIPCETTKLIGAYPDLIVPQVKYMLKDPLAPGTMTNPNLDIEIRRDRPVIDLERNYPCASAKTNYGGINETPIIAHNIKLQKNYPNASGYTNPGGLSATTVNEYAYKLLPPSRNIGPFECKPSMPQNYHDNKTPQLVKVR
jgi:hypothetical protein